MTLYVDCDFETRSACDLRASGAWRYSEDATTEILCLHFAFTDPNTYYCWLPGTKDQLAASVLSHLAEGDAIFVAHNAGFEQAIWANIMVKVHGFPPLSVERWEDTLAACAWKAIPLKLEKAAAALRLPVQKDMDGNRLTLGMSRFNKAGEWPELTPEKAERIAAYCGKDVETERALEKRVGLLSKESRHERDIWLLDQRINQRGVRIDLDFVRQAQLVIERASKPLLAEFRELTGGVNPGQVAKVKEWSAGQGVELENLQKGYLDELLGGSDETDDAGYDSLADMGASGELGEDDLPAGALPPSVRRVLAIRQMLGSASIKKLARMRACVGDDGRARGLLQYHAASTGRWGGRLLQPQNFPRGSLRCSPDDAVMAISSGNPDLVESALGVPAIEAVASSLRHALIPDPGKVFLVGDFAGIEARIVLAMAGQHDKVAMMAAGEDVYLDMACDIYGVPQGSLSKADLEMRQTGKNTVLGCGFGMGWKKFRERYCPKQPEEFAQGVIDTYRQTWAPRVPDLWYNLDNAVWSLLAPDWHKQPKDMYGCVLRKEGDWMTMQLPSRWQKLWYYSPDLRVTPYQHKFKHVYNQPSCLTFKGGRQKVAHLYGGLLTENAVQALARGLLAASMMRIEKAGMPVVLTVHDEVVCEVDEGSADLQAFEQLMAEPTLWAREMKIPIAVEAWEGNRYRK